MCDTNESGLFACAPRMPWIKSCLCNNQEKKKQPVISPPIHLLLKPEGGISPGPGHAFRCKVFKKPRPCHLCHQPIFNQGSCCRVCKYVCHKVCESKEAADRFSDTSWQIHRQWHAQKSNDDPKQEQAVEMMPKNSPSIKSRSPTPSSSLPDSYDHVTYATIKNEKRPENGIRRTNKKVIEIQTVQTTLQRTGPSRGNTPQRINFEDDVSSETSTLKSDVNHYSTGHRDNIEVSGNLTTQRSFEKGIDGGISTPQREINGENRTTIEIKRVINGGNGIVGRSNIENNNSQRMILNGNENTTQRTIVKHNDVNESSTQRTIIKRHDMNDEQFNSQRNKQMMGNGIHENHVNIQRKREIITNEINQGGVTSHTHEDVSRGGSRVNKMISSSSFNGIYGEALTSQPRSARSCSSNGGMDLSYVTERIIALWFPANCGHEALRHGEKQASHMLINKHGDNYMVFNLSDPKRTLRSEHKRVQEVGWSPRLAPPLERICSVCKQIDSWLSSDQHRIAVLLARGSKDKLGVIVAAYMHYSNICGSAEQALDRFSMRKFLEDNIGPLYLPSNKRYVDYFAGLLSHNIRINSAPLYLTHVTVLGAPSFLNGGCRAFLKLYEGQTPIYTSGVYSISSGVSQFTVNVAGERRRGVQLRGDILIKCYHRSDIGRETIFACQFHTCAVADYTLSFTKQELDVACNDPRFPLDGAVELHFSSGPNSRHPGPAPTPAVPVKMVSDDPVTRADSPFDIESDDEDDSDSDDVNHTFGPLDGSIYATIAKKPELSPGAVSSPLTVSMDSGISSAGHQQIANTNTSSSSPPLTGQPSPLTPEDQHAELDQLLSDMLLTVQSIPDLKPEHQHHHTDLENVRFIDEEEDKNIPYHARQDSRPFSYGVNNMIEAKKLASPSLVRKASFNKSEGNTLNKVQTQVLPDFSSKYNNNNNSSDYGYVGGKSSRDSIDNIFTASALSSNYQQKPRSADFRHEYYTTRKSDQLKRSYTDSTLKRNQTSTLPKTPFSDSESLSPPGGFKTTTRTEYYDTYSNNNLTWLQRQQLKLKERREMQIREERQPYENSLMTELRHVQSRHMKPTASHRLDGYTSDTTAFADDDDDFTIPLHINTKHITSPTHQKNERQFVSVQRAHAQQYKNSQSSPEAALAASPMGHAIRSSPSGGNSADGGLLSLAADRDGKHHHQQQQQQQQIQRVNTTNTYREDNYSTWRTNDVDSSSPHSVSSRPQTPAFPVARTPYANSSTPTVQFDLPTNERLPPKSPTTLRRLSYPSPHVKANKKWCESPERKDRPISPSENGSSDFYHTNVRNVHESYQHGGAKSPSLNGSSSPTVYQGNSRRSSVNSNNEPPQEVSPAHVKFVSDSSNYWYKPSISREEAINMLRDQPPGTFVVRNSNTFHGGFGMALKVATVPANVHNKDELVRHFLIEATSRGVRIKGCQNEPVFSSLSALVYQHSITQIALPCRLILPEHDIAPTSGHNVTNQTQLLLVQGAACNVLYLFSLDMESLTGPQAIKKATGELFKQKSAVPCVVHFKVNKQGITLTDNKRKLFFRKHYPINTVSHCGVDPDDRLWNITSEDSLTTSNRIFGFVAKKPASNADNQCHLFAELEPEQPATAIVNFVNKVLTTSGIKPNIV